MEQSERVVSGEQRTENGERRGEDSSLTDSILRRENFAFCLSDDVRQAVAVGTKKNITSLKEIWL